MRMPLHDFIVLWFLYFSLAAFLGWIAESVYRSVVDRRIVSSGFLTGPFIPIYGFGALAIALLAHFVPREPAALHWAILVITPSIVEYASSWLLERLFGLRLWDYSNEPFNFRGRICLLYSSFWVALTLLTVFVLEPMALAGIASLELGFRYYLAGALSMYFLIDTAHSSRAIMYFKAFLAEIRALAASGGSFRPSFSSSNERLPHEIKRLIKPLRAFPHLVRELKPTITTIPEWITEKLESLVGGRHFRK